MSINILIADDHFVVREGLKLILETNDDYKIAAEAANGQEVIDHLRTRSIPVDLVLLDLNMPKMNGLDTLRELNIHYPQLPVIILTTYNEDDSISKGLELGARGYLLKDTGRENLFRTIEAALRGETLLQPGISLKVFGNKQSTNEPVQFEKKGTLTDKQISILQEVAKGATSKEIASRLYISERTVKAHLTTIYNKLGVNKRSEAIAVAFDLGILKI